MSESRLRQVQSDVARLKTLCKKANANRKNYSPFPQWVWERATRQAYASSKDFDPWEVQSRIVRMNNALGGESDTLKLQIKAPRLIPNGLQDPFSYPLSHPNARAETFFGDDPFLHVLSEDNDLNELRQFWDGLEELTSILVLEEIDQSVVVIARPGSGSHVELVGMSEATDNGPACSATSFHAIRTSEDRPWEGLNKKSLASPTHIMEYECGEPGAQSKLIVLARYRIVPFSSSLGVLREFFVDTPRKFNVEFSKVIDFADIRQKRTLSQIERELQDILESGSVPVLSIEIPRNRIARWAPMLIVAIQLYLLIHILAYKHVATDFQAKPVAWIGTYTFPLARAVYIGTSTLLPVWVVFAYDMVSASAQAHSFIYGLITVSSITLAWATVRTAIDTWSSSPQEGISPV